jgi:hypothetical protein
MRETCIFNVFAQGDNKTDGGVSSARFISSGSVLASWRRVSIVAETAIASTEFSA